MAVTRRLDAPASAENNGGVSRAPEPPDVENWVQMQIRGLILDPNSNAPIVILRQLDGSIYLPIWIGIFEANAIAMAVEKVELPRPLTHDLLKNAIAELGAVLERVEIHRLEGGTFFARLQLSTPGGEKEVDARPSDAIALALRSEAPIWTARTVLEAALSDSRATEESDEERIREWLAQARPEDLGKYPM